jgi:acetyl-CoA carboxylase carboxyl transferase subunit alpha
LWRSPENAEKAAEALKLTAQDMEKFKIIDEVIPEPIGGAHRNPEMAINAIGNVLEKRLDTLLSISKEELIKQKEDKYLGIG